VFSRAGILTYRQLASTQPDQLRDILGAAGPQFVGKDPTTWPHQARLAADGRWDDLKQLTERLVGGR
jgi:hypothetical protein